MVTAAAKTGKENTSKYTVMKKAQISRGMFLISNLFPPKTIMVDIKLTPLMIDEALAK